MKKTYPIIFTLFIFFLIGCSASDVTEEYEAGQKDVVYKTEEVASQTQSAITESKTQESNIIVTTQPEYIPQGPPTPPPPPVKVTLEPEPKSTTPKEEVQPPAVSTSPQYMYKVQVFAFKSRLNAESEAKKIRQRMPGQEVYVEFQDNLYKVRLGIYSKWEHAKGIKDALYNLGYTDSFIVTEVKQ